MPKCDLNKVANNFIEIILQHRSFPVHLLHIFRTLLIRTLMEGCFFNLHQYKLQDQKVEV